MWLTTYGLLMLGSIFVALRASKNAFDYLLTAVGIYLLGAAVINSIGYTVATELAKQLLK